VAYPISYRQLEEMMQQRGVDVDHSSLNRWVLKYTPALDQACRQRKRPVGASLRMDETYINFRKAFGAAALSLATVLPLRSIASCCLAAFL
jgi:putative transposase